MKTLVVCGTFNSEGGKPSSLMEKLFFSYPEKDITIFNGGDTNTIHEAIMTVQNYEVIFWFPNVPNDVPKDRDIKELNPKCILITSKRNDGNKYHFKELIARALQVKANLTIEIKMAISGRYIMQVFDPLGNVWSPMTEDYNEVSLCLYERLCALVAYHRQSTTSLVTHKDEKFIEIVRNYATTFHNLIMPSEHTSRFLGNASFRCTYGFPSFRSNTDPDTIFVSKRNVDKQGLSLNDFVPVQFKEGAVNVLSHNKPSVDTPVQVRLYKTIPHINYIVHGHVYVKGAPFTKEAIPCGALEEVDEIMELIYNNDLYNLCRQGYAINLLGHGFIILARDISFFSDDNIRFYARPEREYMGRKYEEGEDINDVF
jgi:uncharacterized glyoxalase superfamily protein PhnB